VLRKLHGVGAVKVSVVIVTYRRAWALPYSLSSIASQTRKPDEVIVVLKPSGDGSEEIISKFSSQLPIKLLIQRQGNVTDAYQMAIDSASGDIILFIDDDAVAEERWIEKYLQLFKELPNAGGMGGATYKAYIENCTLRKTSEIFYHDIPTKRVFYREPLPEYHDYVCWISKSGFMGRGATSNNVILKSIALGGANMAFKRELLAECPLTLLYRRSRKGFEFEQILVHCVKKKGYDTFEIRGSKAPTIWHIVHEQLLTRGKGFWHEFWLHYDRVANYWRLKRLGANVSSIAYLIACIVTLRRRTLPRLLATTYVWFTRV
jgi:glycosyltransferase involved in cell wall biosynthesis